MKKKTGKKSILAYFYCFSKRNLFPEKKTCKNSKKDECGHFWGLKAVQLPLKTYRCFAQYHLPKLSKLVKKNMCLEKNDRKKMYKKEKITLASVLA